MNTNKEKFESYSSSRRFKTIVAVRFLAGRLDPSASGKGLAAFNCLMLSVISRFLISLSSSRRRMLLRFFIIFEICFDWPLMIFDCFLYSLTTEESLDLVRTLCSSLCEIDELDELRDSPKASPSKLVLARGDVSMS